MPTPLIARVIVIVIEDHGRPISAWRVLALVRAREFHPRSNLQKDPADLSLIECEGSHVSLSVVCRASSRGNQRVCCLENETRLVGL